MNRVGQARKGAAARTSALVAVAAIATVLAHPPAGLGWLGTVMLAPIVAAVEGASPWRAFAVVWVYFVSAGLVLVHWLAQALVEEYGVAGPAAWLFTLLVVAGCGLMPSAACAIYAALRPRLPDIAAPPGFAALWILGEWLRSVPLGIPWVLAAHTMVRFPAAIQTADLGGSYAVGFVLVAVNAALGIAARRRSAVPLAVPAVLALGAGLYGASWMAAEPGTGPAVRIAVVQAAVPQDQRFQAGSALRNTEHHAELTRRAALQRDLDLIVWSETAVDTDLDATVALRDRLDRLVGEIGVPLVTGAPRSEGGQRTNSVVLFAPHQGIVESYAKQRLVPFSEYDPELAAPLAHLLGPVVEGEPYLPGTEPLVFRHGPIPFAAPVCFEITYPRMMRSFRAAGAELVVNLSNDAWFGRTGYAEMHFAHAILRSVELRSWTVRGANTGISGFVDPQGRVVAELPIFEDGVISAGVRAAGNAPLYARSGDPPILTFFARVIATSLTVGRFFSPVKSS
jgi:apolipoprotein N-acyltransferase